MDRGGSLTIELAPVAVCACATVKEIPSHSVVDRSYDDLGITLPVATVRSVLLYQKSELGNAWVKVKDIRSYDNPTAPGCWPKLIRTSSGTGGTFGVWRTEVSADMGPGHAHPYATREDTTRIDGVVGGGVACVGRAVGEDEGGAELTPDAELLGACGGCEEVGAELVLQPPAKTTITDAAITTPTRCTAHPQLLVEADHPPTHPMVQLIACPEQSPSSCHESTGDRPHASVLGHPRERSRHNS